MKKLKKLLGYLILSQVLCLILFGFTIDAFKKDGIELWMGWIASEIFAIIMFIVLLLVKKAMDCITH